VETAGWYSTTTTEEVTTASTTEGLSATMALSNIGTPRLENRTDLTWIMPFAISNWKGFSICQCQRSYSILTLREGGLADQCRKCENSGVLHLCSVEWI